MEIILKKNTLYISPELLVPIGEASVGNLITQSDIEISLENSNWDPVDDLI